MAGSIEQRARLVRVMLVSRHVSVISPALRGKNTASRSCQATPQILNYGPPVDGIGNSLPHPRILKNGIAQIESHILHLGAGRLFHGERWLPLQSQHRVGRERCIDDDVSAPFTKFKGLSSRVGNHREAYACEVRLFAPVIIVAFKDDFFVDLGADELEGPGAHGMPRDFISAAPGHNARCSVREAPKQRRVRFLQVEDDSEVIGRIDMIDEAIRRRLSASNLTLKKGVEGPLHIA